jgi:PilZ domain
VSDHSERIRRLRHPVKSTTILHRRWAIRWTAELRTSDGRIACTVEDISRHGAKLRIGGAQVADENVCLVIGGFGPVAGRVMWHRRDRAGVQFNSGQPWILDLVMKAAKDNRWPPRTAR